MARVLITGSTDGLGRAAGQRLLDDGHEVVVRARNRDRLAAVRDLRDRGAAAVVAGLPTEMGGPGAPDDLRLGHLTREWLAHQPRGPGWLHRHLGLQRVDSIGERQGLLQLPLL